MNSTDLLAMLSPAQRRAVEKQLRPTGKAQPVGLNPSGKRKPAHTRGVMNKTEARYADMLEIQRIAGDVLWYGFEFLKFRLGDGAWFTPDFIVIFASGEIHAVEVKGFLREAAGVRFRVAADKYPWLTWVMVERKDGAWSPRLSYPATVALQLKGAA